MVKASTEDKAVKDEDEDKEAMDKVAFAIV